MKEAQILAIVKDPGKPPRVEPLFDNTLEAFQRAVGGYIETVTVCSDLVLVVNEEGRIRCLPFNECVCGQPLYGPIVAVSVKGDEFASLKAKYVPMVMEMLGGR